MPLRLIDRNKIYSLDFAGMPIEYRMMSEGDIIRSRMANKRIGETGDEEAVKELNALIERYLVKVDGKEVTPELIPRIVLAQRMIILTRIMELSFLGEEEIKN
ncbi:MAG: hypothetical protein PHW53_04685 [Patescibacteria group bacterium]|nr:hypothetical protein [Patescibacteria group bacterium]